jgi:uncharacterized membrane-anchored protein
MRLFLALLIAGLMLTLLGFAILFGSMGGGIPIEAGFAGLALIILGPLTVVGGLVAYALQRPTAKELASQKANDYRTWHFRPVGLLILVVALGGFVALANWAEQYIPSINSGRRPVSCYVFGLVCLALLSFRKVRNLVFYTGQIPEAKEADKAGGSSKRTATAGHPRDRVCRDCDGWPT